MTTQEFLDAIKAMPAKVSALAPWKKYLIGGVIVVIILAGTHIGAYVAGTKSLKPYQPPTITITNPKPETDMNEDNPLAYMCGNKIDISTKMVNDKKLQIIAADECKTTTAYFAFAYSCPNPKWSLFIAPGFMLNFSTETSKLTFLLGGGIGFQRHWGNFSMGPEVLYYQSIDSKMFNAGANLRLEYRFGK